MPQISISDFTDIISKAGSPKATKISQVKNRDDYHPAKDFYKSLRDEIVKFHEKNGERKNIQSIMSKISDEKKRANYSQAIAGYSKWWGTKKVNWFEPPRDHYTQGDFEVTVNPEVGLVINGVPHIIKLYFKAESLVKPRANIVTGLMEMTLRDQASPDTMIGILDIKNSKLFTFSEDLDHFSVMVEGELAYIRSVWSKL
jgi:hypothetical protein